MPFVYSEEDREWPEDAGDDYEPPPPLPEQFEYLPPPDFSGAREPVTFSDSASASAASTGPKRPLKERMLMWVLAKILPGGGDVMANLRQQEQDAARSRQQLFAIMVPALRQLGGRRVHCVYDGGNDEGFAWFGSLETAESALTLEEVSDRLTGTGLTEKLLQAEMVQEHADQPRSEREHLREILEYWLPEEWAVLLLGWGFGTGAFSMYGAFTVDLENCTITDDRDAGVPENGNILIGGRDQ